MKNPLLPLIMVVYGLLRWAFGVVVFCVVWKVTQHFWPFMNSVLRLVLALAGGALALQLIGNKFAKPKKSDEN